MKTKVEILRISPMANGQEFMIEFSEDNGEPDIYVVGDFLGRLFQSAIVLGRNQVRRELKDLLNFEEKSV